MAARVKPAEEETPPALEACTESLPLCSVIINLVELITAGGTHTLSQVEMAYPRGYGEVEDVGPAAVHSCPGCC